MAKKKETGKQEKITEEKIYSKPIEEVLHESMIPYSEHVILDRALPRVEDGLKPVQRRILYSMLELGNTPDKPYRKSARIVGDCLGKYHPHGDTSVYDAMVRMAQDFNMRETLIQGHGNFGSVDGDSAAAMRYTEARMTPLAMELLKDLEKETVNWSFNFDDTLKEPDMLPAGFPNLLVNGATGIAVGLATNIPTHNLCETIDGAIALIDNPKITLDEMMKYIPAPDFSTGGYIIVGDELKNGYETGKGKFLIRAKYKIENDGDKSVIVFTELPYQVNKATLLQQIGELKENKGKLALAGIQEIRDESDRNGLRAVIRLKKDVKPEPIIAYLYKNSNLQTQYNMNMVAIANGKPMQLGLIDMLKYYTEYRKEVILKRTKYDLNIAKERAHILEGLMIAIQNIDEVIRIIKTSSSTTEARIALKTKFMLSEKQAQAILDMRLARLTNLEVTKLEKELAELRKLISELTAIVGSAKKQFALVKNELLELKKRYKSPRKSAIIMATDVDDPKEEIIEQAKDVVVAISAHGTIKNIPLKNFNASQKEYGQNSTLYEVNQCLVHTKTDCHVYILTNYGNCFKIKVNQIPECKYKEKGTSLSKLVELSTNEKPLSLYAFGKTLPKDKSIYTFTKEGMVKKSLFDEYSVAKGAFSTIKLKDGDEVISYCDDIEFADRMVLVTKYGNVLCADIEDITNTTRISSGVKAINLNPDDEIIYAALSDGEGEVLTVTDKAYAKRTIIAQIDRLPRNRKGVKISPLNKDCGNEISFSRLVKWPKTIIVQDINGLTIVKNSEDIQIAERTSGGKSVTRSKAGLVVASVYEYVNY